MTGVLCLALACGAVALPVQADEPPTNKPVTMGLIRQAIIRKHLDAMASTLDLQAEPGLVLFNKLQYQAILEARAGRMENAKRYQEALEKHYASSADRDKEYALQALARVSIAMGQWDKAKALLDASTQPFAVKNMYMDIPSAMARAGQLDAARAEARQIIPDEMDRATAYMRMTVLYAQAGRMDEAYAFLQDALDLTPPFRKHIAYMGLAQVYQKRGQPQRAGEVAQDIHRQVRAMTVDSNRLRTTCGLIPALAQLGMDELARQSLEQAHADLARLKDEKDSYTYKQCLEDLGEACAALGQVDRAQAIYNQLPANGRSSLGDAIVLAMVRARQINEALAAAKQNKSFSPENLVNEYDIHVRLQANDLTGAAMRWKQLGKYESSRGRLLSEIAGAYAKAGRLDELDILLATLDDSQLKDAVHQGVIEAMLGD